jgi:anti-sigma factor RsiW
MNQEAIDQYISGRLGEAEAEAFEEYCLAHPEFARHVEYEQRLKAGIAQVARGSTAEFVRSNHPLRWSLAAAAGLLLAIVSIFYLWRHPLAVTSRPVMAAVQTDAQRNGPSLRLALVRGTETTPSLQRGIVRVEIVGLFDLGFHYSVALDRLEQNKKVDTVSTLYSQHPTSPVTLEVMVDSDQLQPGSYSLRVKKQASDEESLDFGFLK